MLDNINLNSFLRFGYYLCYQNPHYQLSFPAHLESQYQNCPEEELVSMGAEKLKQAIRHSFVPGRHHVVPLSGGIDSRMLLAGIMELTEASNISAFTYGTPGSQDYEIGRFIASKAGVEHVALDLSRKRFSIEEALELSRRTNNQSLIFHQFPILEVEKRFPGSMIWSGAIIDVLFGRHYHVNKGKSLEEAKYNFIEENDFVSSINLTNVSNEAFFPLIEYDSQVSPEIMYEHVLDLTNRQMKYVVSNTMPQGLEYGVLFQDNDLVQFSFNVGLANTEHQYLYKKMVCKAFPGLFQYGVKSNFGVPFNAGKLRTRCARFRLSLQRALHKRIPWIQDPWVNYIDFDQGIRCREDIRLIVCECLKGLQKRQIVPWIDIDGIWNAHMKNHKKHA